MKRISVLYLIVFCIFALSCGDENRIFLLQTPELFEPGEVTDLTDEVWQKLEWNRQQTVEYYKLQAEVDPTEVSLQNYQNIITKAEELKQAQEAYYNRYIDADGIAIIGNDIIPNKVYITAANTVLIMTSKHPSLRERFRGNYYMIINHHVLRPPGVSSYFGGRCHATYHDAVREHSFPSGIDKIALGFTNEKGYGFFGLSLTPLPDIMGFNYSNVGYDNNYHLATFVHEFAHCLHFAMRDMNVIADEDLTHDYSYHIKNGIGIDYNNIFDVRLRQAYNNAIEKGIWSGDYAETNDIEYWAELVVTWFFDIGEGRPFATTEELEERDPLGTALLKEWFPQITLPIWVFERY